jgi:phosphoribosyl 1,2-cyclic phosphodiesterase
VPRQLGHAHLTAVVPPAEDQPVVTDAAADADLLIAEAYYPDKKVPYHLRLTDLVAHRDRLGARRIIITHMSAEMVEHRRDVPFETAYDGLAVSL